MEETTVAGPKNNYYFSDNNYIGILSDACISNSTVSGITIPEILSEIYITEGYVIVSTKHINWFHRAMYKLLLNWKVINKGKK